MTFPHEDFEIFVGTFTYPRVNVQCPRVKLSVDNFFFYNSPEDDCVIETLREFTIANYSYMYYPIWRA